MINKQLFNMLRRRFNNNVQVFNEDVEMDAIYTPSLDDYTKKFLSPVSPGEEYRVSCYKCSDTRFRLYINHRWGVYDPQSNSRNLWLANCWNENCFSEYLDQKAFADEVYDTSPLNLTDLSAGKPQKLLGPGKVHPPGAMWLLDDLVEKSPYHSCIEYLQSRLIDPAYLGRMFGVGYCSESSFTKARHRIMAPVYYGGKLVTWQARYIGDPPRGVEKWYTCPDSHKSFHLYNVERATQFHTLLLVEGPADVWGVGLPGTAIMGKVISTHQVKLLERHFQPGTTIAIVLDPKQDERETKKKKEHHIERTYKLIMANDTLRHADVLRVYMPNVYDPGDVDREYTHDLVRWYGRKAGVKVSFAKRKAA